MQINVIGTNSLPITPALTEQVMQKFKKLEKFFAPVEMVDVRLECRSKHEMIATANVKLPHKILHASVTEDDMYKAIALLSKKIDLQAKKYHDSLGHSNHASGNDEIN